jgi:hypothetical protein
MFERVRYSRPARRDASGADRTGRSVPANGMRQFGRPSFSCRNQCAGAMLRHRLLRGLVTGERQVASKQRGADLFTARAAHAERSVAAKRQCAHGRHKVELHDGITSPAQSPPSCRAAAAPPATSRALLAYAGRVQSRRRRAAQSAAPSRR